jgi:FixJ family two-component response regulator
MATQPQPAEGPQAVRPDRGNGALLGPRPKRSAAAESGNPIHPAHDPLGPPKPWHGNGSGAAPYAPATVFAIDADAASLEVVRKVATTMNLACQTYVSGQEFLAAYETSQAGCVILEMRIPGISGLQIQEYLVTRKSLLPVIFVSSELTVSMAVRVMRSGAINVLEKPFRENELWDAIEEGIQLNRQRVEFRTRRSEDQRRLESLTEKERQVLLLLADGKSKKTIAREMEVCVRTVEIRRNQLMEKLGATTLAELVRFALLVFNGEAEPAGDRLPARTFVGPPTLESGLA